MKQEKELKQQKQDCTDCRDAVKETVRAYGLGEKSQFDDETLTVRGVVISSTAIDSYETRFDVTGVELERFQANPILLFNHDDYNRLPIGKVNTIRQDGDLLLADIQLEDVTDGEVSGRHVYSLLKAGFLNGFSIRFEPLDWHTETVDEREITVFDKWRLLEVSVVNIPANPEAVVIRSHSKPMTAEDVKALFVQFKKEEEEAKAKAEKQRKALSADLSAALKDAYRSLGKALAESKK